MGKITHIISLLYSLYYNLIIFGLDGWRLPLIFNYKVRVTNAYKGCVKLHYFKTGTVMIGFGGVDSQLSRKSVIDFNKGVIVFLGKAQFSEGVIIKNKGILIFGADFSANKNCTFSCTQNISFGDLCLLGWNIHVRDSDGHFIYYNGYKQKSIESVVIGRHVWIASECHILKGTVIPNDCVVGYKSLLNRKFDHSCCIIAGHPAVVVKENIIWEK